MVGPPDLSQVFFLAIFGVGSELDSGSSFITMTSFLGGVLRKLIGFHSVDINRRENVSYYVKGLLYYTNICKEIYVIVLHIAMQGDIFYCIAYRYANRYKHMQGDIFHCIVYRYANRYKHMQGDIFYCIAYRYAKRYEHMQADIFYCIAYSYGNRYKNY